MVAFKTKSEAIKLLENFKGEDSIFIIVESDSKVKTFEQNVIPSLFLPVNPDVEEHEILTLEQIKHELENKTKMLIPLAAIFHALAELGFRQTVKRIDGYHKYVYCVQRVK